ncbi:MAG: LamG domain-containing protein, partial [Pseudomonadota bacterium]
MALLLVAIEVSAGSRSLRISGADDRIVVPNSPQLNPPGAITIEAWVRPGGTTFCRTIVDKNRTSGYSLAICNGKLRFYTSGLNSSRDGVSDIPIGEWTHVAVTFDGVRRVYYINGIIDFEADTPAPLPVNTSELFIGGAPSFSCGFSSCNFIGDIAEVRVWDVARSRSDIREDIAVQISEPRDGLAGLWHLENSARESFGRYASVVEGDATFLGLGAPPVRDNPLRIPRMLVPDFDGRCDNYTSNLRIPVWNEGPFERLQWLNLGASGAFLYACLEGMQFSAGGFAALYIDPTNDATTFAQPDDFRAVVTSGGSFFTEAGAGNSGGFMPGGPA